VQLLVLGPDALRLRLEGKTGCFSLVKFFPARVAFPKGFAAERGFVRFQLAQKRLDGVIQRFDNVAICFLGVQNVGRHAEIQGSGVQILLHIAFQRHLQVNAPGWEMFEILFELGDFFVQLFAKQEMSFEVFGDEIPGERSVFRAFLQCLSFH